MRLKNRLRQNLNNRRCAVSHRRRKHNEIHKKVISRQKEIYFAFLEA